MAKSFAGLVAGLLCASAAYAADIAVLPVGLSLGAGHDRAPITITNQGAEAVVMQVETVSWNQAEGEDRYSPSRDLLVNPPLFKLLPGHSQVLRVGLRRPPAGERERAYRLFLREVPSPVPANPVGVAGGQAHIRVLLEMRLPVYVAPAKVVRSQDWQSRRTADGSIRVELANTGNVHLVVTGLKLRAADAAPDSPPLAATQAGGPVFPGQRRSWLLRPQVAASGQRYSLEVTTDLGTQNVVLDPAPE